MGIVSLVKSQLQSSEWRAGSPAATAFPNSGGCLINGENAVVEGPIGSVIGRAGQFRPNSDVKNEALRFGAHLQDIDKFDAEFFRISPVEALLLDPQQRMMLETTWHALEDAGMDPGSLRDSRTGIYAGISIYDYREATIDAAETRRGSCWSVRRYRHCPKHRHRAGFLHLSAWKGRRWR